MVYEIFFDLGEGTKDSQGWCVSWSDEDGTDVLSIESLRGVDQYADESMVRDAAAKEHGEEFLDARIAPPIDAWGNVYP